MPPIDPAAAVSLPRLRGGRQRRLSIAIVMMTFSRSRDDDETVANEVIRQR